MANKSEPIIRSQGHKIEIHKTTTLISNGIWHLGNSEQNEKYEQISIHTPKYIVQSARDRPIDDLLFE